VSLHLRDGAGTLRLDLPEASRKLLFADETDTVDFEVATENGKHADGAHIPPPTIEVGHTSRNADMLYNGTLNGVPVRVVQHVVAADAALGRPAARVRVAETKNKRNALAREILVSAVLPQALIIIIAAVLVWAGVARGLAPLERVRLSVTQRARNDHSPVAVAGVPGEVRPLLLSINELLASLDAALTLQSRFISDAAHQLKTPIAVLETQLELALRESNPAQMRRQLEQAHVGLDRLSHVVNQILALARNEPEAARQLVLVPLDLNALALAVCSRWVPEALKRRIDLGFEDAGTPVTIDGDAMRLAELCDNLIDNAIRYSQVGGRVTVRVCASPRPSLAVSDDSPSIPHHERERVFERFHRLLGNTAQGSGLGLAIVKEIAHMHGAGIRLIDDADGTGHTFIVEFSNSNE
jgi:two-component system sensor histidine kinase TctE